MVKFGLLLFLLSSNAFSFSLIVMKEGKTPETYHFEKPKKKQIKSNIKEHIKDLPKSIGNELDKQSDKEEVSSMDLTFGEWKCSFKAFYIYKEKIVSIRTESNCFPEKYPQYHVKTSAYCENTEKASKGSIGEIHNLISVGKFDDDTDISVVCNL